MNDAGEFNGRADSVPHPDQPAAQKPATSEGGLSKRAARRRRKRRAASGDGGERVETVSAPAAVKEKRPDRRRAPEGGDEAARAGKRTRRAKRPHPPAPGRREDSLRGVRQTQPTQGGRGDAPARTDARGRRGGEGRGRPQPPQPPVRQIDGTGNDVRRLPARTHEGDGHRPHGRGGAPLYAALDLGTNNCRLLIAEPQERGFRVVDAFSRIVRLGEGIGKSGRLGDAAMDRAVEALAICRQKMADHDVRRMRLVATEACRAADNGTAFLERVRAETGLALEIVNRETEARLAVAGCATLVDRRAEGVLLFDIGGGSSELVWLDLRNRGEARGVALTRFIKAWTSLPVGVVTLSERHGGVTVTPDVFDAMVDEVAAMVDAFTGIEDIAPVIARGGVHMLGTSGTVTTLAGIHLGLKRYDRRRVDGVWLEDADVDQMVGRLVAMSYEERVANPCIGADRADLVLAGCAILEGIRRRWPCPRLRVADRGLREGILVELMARDGVWRRRPRPAPVAQN
ncbi:Ppx/GppA phosphatase family protein [Oharaeibacter diazotrophicus]|uniref:Exopolyphosphatase/guanosine-5'-triphosphate, 3'-diphosphate pyrophosphatase n=2 Tax=Oharaeibacter diazotrophicus TaxID=1920512 RepID=A0A4R6RKU4_9HYPH|nr:Ppx/GppA phosphatase family protein [Oharaeibacter diazotrophicus]TDP86577.1 exopolyphosphatase/guanosine-5'-triphosphate,3'-diphosphate pyrophosphatase [Oharaeibacter diazotrophicus]BBE71481.1 exopolyphosphatase [Pleomorphomonas sp. SM30]